MFFMKLLAALGIACALGGSASAQTPVTIPEDYPAKEVDVEFTADGPTLLFSDSPEMVYKTGVLYRDTVQGKLRLFFHHVNAVEQDKKLAVLVKNEDQLRPAAYKITRSGVGNLSYNYMEAGKEAQQLYFADAQKGYDEWKETGRSMLQKSYIIDPDSPFTKAMFYKVDCDTADSPFYDACREIWQRITPQHWGKTNFHFYLFNILFGDHFYPDAYQADENN